MLTSPRTSDLEFRELLTQFLETYARHRPVRRVAVVGNAPLEPDAARAEQIDSADLVIRCNSFVLDKPGGEPRLGRRVDVVVLARVTRPTVDVFDEYWRRAYLVVDAGNSRTARPPRHLPTWPADLGCIPIPNSTLGLPLKSLLAPERDGYGVVPTTGTIAAYLGHELFPDAALTLAGYSFVDQPQQEEWQHQYGTVVPVHSTHWLDRESALLQSWIDAGRAVLVR